MGGWGPGVEAAKPEVVPSLLKGDPEFQQAGTDTAPVVPTEHFLPDCLPRVVGEYPMVVEGRYEVTPRRAGVPLGGRHIGVTPGEVGHKSVPPALVCGALVGEGQQGAVRDRLPPNPQPAAAVQLRAQHSGEVGGEHEEQGSWNVAQPGQGVSVRRPLLFEMRHGEPRVPVFWREQPDGGCVAPPCAYLRGSEHVGGPEHEAGGMGAWKSEDTSPLHPVWASGATCSHSVAATSHGRSGPAPRITVGRGWVCGPRPSNGMAACCGVGVPGAPVVAHHQLNSRAQAAPTMCAFHTVMELCPMIHSWKSLPRRCFEKSPGRSR